MVVLETSLLYERPARGRQRRGHVPRTRAAIAWGVARGALRRREPGSHRRGADLHTLGTRFDPRNNNLGLLRLLLALIVGMTHALEIGYGWQPELAGTQLGALSVDAFFVLSGFLLAGSYLRLNSVRRYAWHRFLRIMPGFWVCLLVTAVVFAPLMAVMQGEPIAQLLTGDGSAVDYVLRNGGLLIRQWGISGLPIDVPQAGVVNGSLWTLFYEALCYGSIVILGVCGGLRRHPVMALGSVGLLWLATVLNESGIIHLGEQRMLRLLLMFLIGAVLHLYAHQIPVNRLLTLGCAALLLVSVLLLDDYRALAAPAFGYLCLAAAVARLHLPRPRTDISYGLYVYHWPLLQLVALTGVTHLTPWVFVPTGLGLAVLAATLSWNFVEKPAMALKDAAWVTSALRAVPRPRGSSGSRRPPA